jgi:hypothetical protein
MPAKSPNTGLVTPPKGSAENSPKEPSAPKGSASPKGPASSKEPAAAPEDREKTQRLPTSPRIPSPTGAPRPATPDPILLLDIPCISCSETNNTHTPDCAFAPGSTLAGPDQLSSTEIKNLAANAPIALSSPPATPSSLFTSDNKESEPDFFDPLHWNTTSYPHRPSTPKLTAIIASAKQEAIRFGYINVSQALHADADTQQEIDRIAADMAWKAVGGGKKGRARDAVLVWNGRGFPRAVDAREGGDEFDSDGEWWEDGEDGEDEREVGDEDVDGLEGEDDMGMGDMSVASLRWLLGKDDDGAVETGEEL